MQCHFWPQKISIDWWHRIVLDTVGDQQWQENFRMEMFMKICAELAPELQQQQTSVWCPISMEKPVAFPLWKLAIPEYYWSITNKFTLERVTVLSGEAYLCKVPYPLILSTQDSRGPGAPT